MNPTNLPQVPNPPQRKRALARSLRVDSEWDGLIKMAAKVNKLGLNWSQIVIAGARELAERLVREARRK